MKAEYKDLKIRCLEFSLRLIKFVNIELKGKFYYSIIDQVIRSGTSIGANIIEAKAASSKKDFINYYQIALKSANETVYWLELIKYSKSFPKELDLLINESIELSKILGTSIIKLKSSTK